MTKKDIVRVISEEVGLTQQQTKKIVQKTFDTIIDTLVREERIELRNFGVFEVKPRAARKARNPRTGKQVDVPAKYVVTFKPGKEMEARVQELDARAAEAAQRTGEGRQTDAVQPSPETNARPSHTSPSPDRPSASENSQELNNKPHSALADTNRPSYQPRAGY